MNEEIITEFNYRKPFSFKRGDHIMVEKSTRVLNEGTYCLVYDQLDSIMTNEGVPKMGNYYQVKPINGSKKYVIHEKNVGPAKNMPSLPTRSTAIPKPPSFRRSSS